MQYAVSKETFGFRRDKLVWEPECATRQVSSLRAFRSSRTSRLGGEGARRRAGGTFCSTRSYRPPVGLVPTEAKVRKLERIQNPNSRPHRPRAGPVNQARQLVIIDSTRFATLPLDNLADGFSQFFDSPGL